MNYQYLKKSTAVISASVITFLTIGASSGAVTIGQIDDFQDGTTQGWVNSLSMSTAPSNQANSGPGGVGDNALFGLVGGAPDVYSIGNSTQWAGDYVAAGITTITFDIYNLGDSAFDLGILINGGTAATFSVPVPVSGAWASKSIDLTTLVFGSSSTLSNVVSIELVSLSGGVVTSVGALDVLIDNIQAVPEPSVALFSVLTFASMTLVRRRSA